MKMEEVIISNCRSHSKTQRIGDKGDTVPRLVTDSLKNRKSQL